MINFLQIYFNYARMYRHGRKIAEWKSSKPKEGCEKVNIASGAVNTVLSGQRQGKNTETPPALEN
jgi:hypothetical protein